MCHCHWVSSAAILRDHSAFIYRDKQALLFFKILGTAHAVTERCTPEGVDLQQRCCENLESCTVRMLHLLNSSWSSTLIAPSYTLAFLTMQLLTERPKEMVMESDKPGLKKG
jgi:hypothetical protein